MPGLNHGRLWGVAWCCTVDDRGGERDVAFGWTRRQARRRCLHKLRMRTATEAGPPLVPR
jgi:hypothetical protein